LLRVKKKNPWVGFHPHTYDFGILTPPDTHSVENWPALWRKTLWDIFGLRLLRRPGSGTIASQNCGCKKVLYY